MKSRLVVSLALGGLAAAGFAGCGAGERFSPECETGTVLQDGNCVKVAAAGGAGSGTAGVAGAAGAGTAGVAGGGNGGTAGIAGGGSGGTAGVAAGGAGTAGAAGTGVAGTGGAGAGGGGGGTAGVAGGSGTAGTGGAAGASGSAGSAGTGGGEPPLWKSGTRLRAYVRDLGNGVKAFAGWEEYATLINAKEWHDSQLGAYCRFAKAVDGTTRCVPGRGVQEAYADSTCKTPVFTSWPCAELTEYDHVVIPSDCGGPETWRAVKLGKKLGVSTFFYQKTGQGCMQVNTPPTVAFAAGPDVPPDQLVGATMSIEPAGALSRRVLTGADGSRQVIGAYDPTYKSPCTSTGGDGICQPTVAPVLGSTSPTCALTNVAFGPGPSCGGDAPVVAVAITPGDGCTPPSAAFFELQKPIPASEVWSGQTGTCKPASSSGSFFLTGAGIPTSSFPSLSQKKVGTGRVRSLQLASGGTDLPPDSSNLYFDTETGQKCILQKLANGKEYCIPEAVAGIPKQPTGAPTYFADSGCNTPATQPLFLAGPCGPLTLGDAILDYSTECGATPKTVFKRGKALASAYEMKDGTCTPVVNQGTSFEVGPEIAPPWADLPLSVE